MSEQTEEEKSKRVRLDPSWAGRRRVVRCTLLSCLGLTIYSMVLGPQMAGIVVPTTGSLAAAVIGFYVGGASWERVSGIPSKNEYTK